MVYAWNSSHCLISTYEYCMIPAQTVFGRWMCYCAKEKWVYEMHGLQLSCFWYYSTHSVILENCLTSIYYWELHLKAAIHSHSAGAKISSKLLKCFIPSSGHSIDRTILFSCTLSLQNMAQNSLFCVSCVLCGERGTSSIEHCSLSLKTALPVYMLHIRKTMHYHTIIFWI